MPLSFTNSYFTAILPLSTLSSMPLLYVKAMEKVAMIGESNYGVKIISTTHLLAAVFRAVNDWLNGRLKSKNVHSEIVFCLSMNNNVRHSSLGCANFLRGVILSYFCVRTITKKYDSPLFIQLAAWSYPFDYFLRSPSLSVASESLPPLLLS